MRKLMDLDAIGWGKVMAAFGFLISAPIAIALSILDNNFLHLLYILEVVISSFLSGFLGVLFYTYLYLRFFNPIEAETKK